MAVELKVPPLGESITEAVVGKWNKKKGESVSADEPLVVLETDKVTIDVPAPATGAIATIAFNEGDKVRVGDVLGTIEAGAGASAPAPQAAAPAAAPAPAAAAPVAAASAGTDVRMTPTARKIVEENKLDVAQLKGSGTGGRITKEDALGQLNRPAEAPAQRAPAPAAPSGPRPRADREERVKMTPLRRRVAERLVQAQSTAAILTTFNEVDMGAVMELRKQHQEKFLARHGVKLGFMSFFIRAAVEALKAFPQVNAEIDGDDVVFKHYYDIGVAVSGSRGLVVPVVRDADTQSMAELEKKVGDYGTRARNDKLTLAELQGGTFTITNGGIFGSMLSTPIINPPQTGILGMHNIVERPVARNGQVVIRPIMYLALSYDHRLIDGREAVQFLVRIKDCIEDPTRLLLEI
ncbi:2-oxoglutarate dehydrogenase complex dihydrolipoyllysine-residue succinyltransferase [Archangium violaceum]|uniref:Dihydrolipoyllysine-residue succinyltransferase component of 2-oxoglutarate dehydrogenase complex n=1 Tax=Archangium violaceum Cb vi76 TaxID=1406225 RepID=A0A084SL96_9BACT|nr:2-oxoglutarate dehydrogenase complex dihydrolipoyllysine-residue succinyltransferase [Archangium violaceum]KFA89231.1 dihydrolipoamide succinyltransferase [Archangium violaceum Cb vi76]